MRDTETLKGTTEEYTELVQQTKEGDKKAFTQLYTLTYPEIYHTVKVFVHQEDTAQDIVQEVYYKGLKKIRQLKEPEKFPKWIKKIAINTAKAHLRKIDWILFSEVEGEGAKSIAQLQDERTEHLPEIVVEQSEKKVLLDEILETLDEKQRMVVRMFYYEQMSVNEIADELSCSANTVKSRLNYARKKIEKKVSEIEKKGVDLRTAAPIPLLMYLFDNLRKTSETVPEGKYLAKTGISKLMLAGVTAAAVCVGIHAGIMIHQDRYPQVQEVQERLVETVPQNVEEIKTSPDKKTVRSENSTFQITPTPGVTPQPTATPETEEKKETTATSVQKTSVGQDRTKTVEDETTGMDGTAEASAGESMTSDAETEQHDHQWVPQTETIHHEASGHYETRVLEEAYEEPVYEYHVFCSVCGADVTTDAQEHKAVHDGGLVSRKVQTGSIHHDAETEQVWVEEPAYDEVVTRGSICSICHAAQ